MDDQQPSMEEGCASPPTSDITDEQSIPADDRCAIVTFDLPATNSIPAGSETSTPIPTEPPSTVSTPLSRRSSGFGPASLNRQMSSTNFMVAAVLAALKEEEEHHDHPPSYEEATSVHPSRQPSRQTSRQVSRRNSFS